MKIMKIWFKVFAVYLVFTLTLSPALPLRLYAQAPPAGSPDAAALTFGEALETALSGLSELAVIENDLKQIEARKTALNRQLNDLSAYISKEKGNTRGYRNLIETLEESIAELDEKILDAAFSENGSGAYLAVTEDLKAQRNTLRQRLNETNALLEIKDDSEFSKETARKNIDILTRQAELLELNRETAKLSVELSLRSVLKNITDYDLDAELMAEGIALNEESLRRATLLNSLGKASDGELRDAENALSQSKAGLETLLTARENERKKLNTLLRLPLSSEVTVGYPEEEAVEEEEPPADIGKHIESVYLNDPMMKTLRKLIEIRTLEHELQTSLTGDSRKKLNDTREDYNDEQDLLDEDDELYDIVPELEPKQDIEDNNSFFGLKQTEWDYDLAVYDRESTRLAAENAERDLADARLRAEASAHWQFNLLSQLSQRENALLGEIENATRHVEMTEVRLDAGKATRYELDLAQYEISKLNNELNKIENSKRLTMFLLKYPLLEETLSEA